MKKDDILICKFMKYTGVRYQSERGLQKFYSIPDPKDNRMYLGFFEDDLPFSKSWDFLVPIIKKCNKIQPREYVKNGFDVHIIDEIMESLFEFDINKVYDKVVNHIKIRNNYVKFYNNGK